MEQKCPSGLGPQVLHRQSFALSLCIVALSVVFFSEGSAAPVLQDDGVASCVNRQRIPAGARPPGPAIQLRIHEQTDVSPDVLERAMARVQDSYRPAGVRVEWAAAEPETDDGVPLFDVVITHGDLPDVIEAIDGTAGRALAVASRVYVFYNVIRNAAAAYKVSQAALLGDVISHEIGHVLLPPLSHSARGIMSPDVVRQGVAPSFEPRQQRAIARRLLAGEIGRKRATAHRSDRALCGD